MARTRSVAYVRDSTTIPFLYSKNDPSTGAPFDNTQITACTIAIYAVADGSSLLAPTAMTYDAALGGYRYSWTHTGSARYILAVMTPTRAGSATPALAPIDREVIDLADTLERIDETKALIGTNETVTLHAKLGSFDATQNLKAILGNLSTTKPLGEILGAFTTAENLKAIIGAYSSTNTMAGAIGTNQTSIQTRLGAFDATENLKALLGDLSVAGSKRLGQILGGLTETSNLKATLGTYTNSAPLSDDLTAIKGTGFATGTDSLKIISDEIDALQTQIDALDAGSSTTFTVPNPMVVPESGTKVYNVHLRIYDDNGTLVAPNALPTFTFVGGTPTGVTLSAFSLDGGTGKYTATVTVGTTAVVDTAFSVAANYARTDGGATQNYEFIRTTTLNDNAAVHDLIYQDTQYIRNDLLGNATFGLSALNNDLDSIISELGVDASSYSVHEKLGALTTTANLKALLGGLSTTDTLTAILGAFTAANTLKHNIEVIQGHVGN